MSRFWDEVGEMAMQKMAQGAAEIGQALNSQADAYVPYGAGQQALEVEGPQQSWQEQLKEASQRSGQDQEMER
jgi:hypothetical protein